jgi:WxL domain surface cell wall-binding
MPYLRSLRCLLAAAATAAALLTFAPLAGAATANDTTQFAVTPGSLVFSTAPDVPNLPALTLNGQAQTLNAQMASFSMSDYTGSGSGWNVSVIGDSAALKSPVFKEYCDSGSACGSVPANSYASGGATLAANSLTLSSTGAGFTAQNGTTGTAPTHQCSSACNVDSASTVKIVSAATNAGMGTYQANGYGANSLALSAPTTIQALAANEVYRVDLVWSLNSGP